MTRAGTPFRLDEQGPHWFADPAPGDQAEIDHIRGLSFDLEDFAAAWPEIYARAPGFRPPLQADPFEMLVTSTTAQQISLRAACAMRNRFTERFGTRIEHDGVVWYRFPRAEAVQGKIWKGWGSRGPRSARSRALAEADLRVDGRSDEELRAHLLLLPGIGPWTLDWFFARCLGRPDAFAPGDLGVRKAVAQWFSDEPIWPEPRVREACLPFGRHANLAVHYLLLPEGG